MPNREHSKIETPEQRLARLAKVDSVARTAFEMHERGTPLLECLLIAADIWVGTIKSAQAYISETKPVPPLIFVTSEQERRQIIERIQNI